MVSVPSSKVGVGIKTFGLEQPPQIHIQAGTAKLDGDVGGLVRQEVLPVDLGDLPLDIHGGGSSRLSIKIQPTAG